MRTGWGGAVVGALMLVAGAAHADNHLIAFDEVLGSWQGDDTAQFIELRMLAPGQTALSAGGGTDIVTIRRTRAGARQAATYSPTLWPSECESGWMTPES